MSDTKKYELELVIKEGTFSHPCPVSNLFVATSIDGVMNKEDNTDIVKLDHGRVVWNKRIVKTFETLEPAIPIMISMSMYRKNRFHAGSKLIGTAHFSISELIPILNKEGVQGRIQLNVKKNTNSTSSFLLALKLRSVSKERTSLGSGLLSGSQKVPLTLQYRNDDAVETVSSKFETNAKEPFSWKIILSALAVLLVLVIAYNAISL